jgi:hypothetical protein
MLNYLISWGGLDFAKKTQNLQGMGIFDKNPFLNID